MSFEEHWPTDIEKRVYRDAQNACGISVGDAVRVMRAVQNYTGGWCNIWDDGMSDCIGRVGKVIDTDKANGIGVKFPDGRGWKFPFFVLEKADAAALDQEDFAPFTKVLVRDHAGCEWTAALYSHRNDPRSEYPYITCSRMSFKYCIPYEGNEHLLGTTDVAFNQE